jgi:hypothetical protein
MKTYYIEFTNEKADTELVEKWNGKEITLFELESILQELGPVMIFGSTIEVYNGYRE